MNHPADPTEPLPLEPDADEAAPSTDRGRRRVLYGLGALLIAGGVAVGVWALAGAGAGSPVAGPTPDGVTTSAASSSASPAPSVPVAAATPTASVVETPVAVPPAEGAPTISAFSVDPAEALCPDERESTVPLSFSWASEGGERAWIGVGTSDASVQPTAEVDLNADAYTDVSFACRDADQVFTLTVEGAGGTTSSTIAIGRVLE